jgi:hypothetical protein
LFLLLLSWCCLPANGRLHERFFGTERTLSADTIIRSVFARTARR